MALNRIFSVVLLISVISAEILYISDDETVLQYPGDFNCTGADIVWEINVVSDGLGVVLIVNETNLDTSDASHLIFTADKTGSGKDRSVVYLTGTLTDIWLAVPLVQKAYLTFSSPGCNENTTLTATLKQYEMKAPDVEVTTPNPYPPSGMDTEIAVHFIDATVDTFNDPDFLTKFQEYFQNAAFEFCKKNQIFYNSTKSANETVFVRMPQTCSNKWPDYEKCVQILLAIYVTNPRTEYELSVAHLREFWAEIEQNGLPSSLGVQPYEFPNVSLQILWWLGWLLIALIVTAGIAFILWRVEIRADGMRMRLIDEEESRRRESIFRGVQLRNQPAHTLNLSKHQKLPKFMEKNYNPFSKKPATTGPTKKLEFKLPFGKNNKTEASSSAASSPTSPSVETPARFYKPTLLEEESTET